MHIERIKAAIKMMESARSLNMRIYQGGDSTNFATTIEELHECGNTACFAGYLAISPEFQAAGGRMRADSGTPVFPNPDPEDTRFLYNAEAVAAYLEIPESIADALVFGNDADDEDGLDEDPGVIVYPRDVKFKDLKPEHVVTALTRILNRELQ